MKTFIICIFTATLFTIQSAASPNIVYILADDMGYGDVGALNPNCKFPTPHLDQLAADGMAFTDAHTNSSCCTPTRYGIMTGRYAWRTPLKRGVLNGYGNLMIDTKRMTIASLLKQKGYQTACIGKWHMGLDWPSTDGKSASSATSQNCDYASDITGGPLDVGFGYFYGLAGSLGMPPHGFVENRRLIGELGERMKGKSKERNTPFFQCRPGQTVKGFNVYNVLEELTKRGVDYVKKASAKKQPFFLYLSLNSPHSPVAPRHEWQEKSGINPYADFVMETDWTVGQIVKALKDAGVSDNTMVLFTTDNGCSQTAGFDVLAKAGHRPGHLYRGLKGSLYEGGHRVPHLVKWPSQTAKGSVSNETICTTDFLATLAELHDVKLRDSEGEDSVSFLPALRGKAISTKRTGIVHHSSDGHFAYRQGKWKLILHKCNGMTKRKDTGDLPQIKNPGPSQLFDLVADPTESNNLYGSQPEIVAQLKKNLSTIISNGRSTAGMAQENAPAKKGWPQIEWINRNKAKEAQ